LVGKTKRQKPLRDRWVDERITLNYVIKEIDQYGSEQTQYGILLTRAQRADL